MFERRHRFANSFDGHQLAPAVDDPALVECQIEAPEERAVAAGLGDERVAALYWNPVALPAAVMRQMIGAMRTMAASAGCDPEELDVVVRGSVYITEQPLGEDRIIFRGSLNQIRSDVEEVRDLGASELFFDLNFSDDVRRIDRLLSRMGQLREMAGEGLHAEPLAMSGVS